MTRVGTYASDLYSLFQVQQLHQSVDNLSQQSTSGLISQNYEGIAGVANQTLDFQDQQQSIQGFQTDNSLLSTKLSTMQSVYSNLQTTMTQFQQQLQNFITNDQSSPQDVASLQQFAFQSLQNMEYGLNTQIEGQYIFSGSNTDTPPVSINANTLSAFQQAYDGYNVAYPTTGAADLSTANTTVLNTGSLTFNAANGTITAGQVGQFADIPVGGNVTLNGSASYSGTYTVLNNDGTTITVSHNLTSEGSAATPSPATITIPSTTGGQPTAFQGTFSITGPDTITANTVNGLSSLSAGTAFTISGATNASNDGNYVVAATDGTHVVIQRANLTGPAINVQSAAADSTATISNTGSTFGASGTVNTGPLTFTAATGTTAATIAAGVQGSFNGTAGGYSPLESIAVGSVITVNNAGNPANDGQYLVTGMDTSGTTLTVVAAGNQTSLNSETTGGATLNIGSTDLTSASTGNLTFYPNSSIVTAGTAGSLSSFKKSETVNVSGTASNNGAYMVIGTYDTPVIDENSSAATITGGGTNLANGTAGQVSFTAGPPSTISSNTAISPVNLTPDANDAGSLITYGASTFGAGGSVSTGNLSFTAPNTISAATGGTLANIPVGASITIAGGAANNNSYIVTGNDGTNLTVALPVGADANLASTAADNSAVLSQNGQNFGSASADPTGALSFTSPDTITAADAGSLQNVQVGSTITISNAANSANDGTYVVTGNSGTTLTLGAAGSFSTIAPGTPIDVSGTASNNGQFVVTGYDAATNALTVAQPDTAMQVASNLSLSSTSYYQGDSTEASQQIDVNNVMQYGVTASNTAFEKAIRAMALIAQGQPGTAGGLSMNTSRLQAAQYLISDAIDGTTSGTAPYGKEQTGNLSDLNQTLATQQSALSSVSANQTTYLNYVQTAQGKLTNADPTTTITELLNQENSLQASYQVLASVRNLSLLNYLK